MPETIILDPSEVAVARTELDISSGAIRVQAATGVDWGDAEIQGYVAEYQRGESFVDFRVPNRKINIPLVIQTSGTVSFTQARQKLQAKVARIQSEGGWLRRVTSNAGTVFMDVVNATLHLPGGWMQANREVEHEATLALEALPDFYGAEITLADHTEATAAELVFTETGIKGDYPGRVRLVVDNDQATDQLGLIWSFRSRHYSSASTAVTKYEAEALTAIDTATKTALAGASGGTVVQQLALSNIWTPVLNTNLAAGTYLTHTGTNRVFARVYSAAGTAVQARLVWDVGDIVNPAENASWQFTAGSAFFIADLGEVRLDAAPVGTHRWQGQIQAKGAAGGEDFRVDKVWIVNADEGMGVLTSPPVASVVSEARLAWDTFANPAYTGALAGEVAPLGGTWSGAGDADDFTVDTTNDWIQRTATSDADANTGRYARLGTGVATTTTVQVDLGALSTLEANHWRGVFARYVDTSNWVQAVLYQPAFDDLRLLLRKRVAGTVTDLGFYELTPATGAWTVRLSVGSDGQISVYAAPTGGALGNAKISINGEANFTSGGALDDGGYGIYDAATTASLTRTYDNFDVTTPVAGQVTQDAIIYVSRSAQLCHNGHFRLDSGGTAYGPVSRVVGDLPRIPPAGLEGRTTEIFLKGSRGDLDQLSDSGIDDISARVSYRPSWLFIPE